MLILNNNAFLFMLDTLEYTVGFDNCDFSDVFNSFWLLSNFQKSKL